MQDAPAQSNSVSVLPLAGCLDETALFLDMLIIKRSKMQKRGAGFQHWERMQEDFGSSVSFRIDQKMRLMLAIKEDRRLLQGTYIKSTPILNKRIRT
jgi:hypothetical protein